MYHFCLENCGKSDGFLLESYNGDVETQWTSGYEGNFFNAYVPDISKVRSYKWRINQNGNVEEFFFESEYDSQRYERFWKNETKFSTFYEVENNVKNGVKNIIYSSVNLLKKTSEDTEIDIEFIMTDDNLVEKSCIISNNTFKS